MLLSAAQLKEILLDTGLVTEDDWASASANAARRGRDIGDILIERGLVNVQYLYELIAEKHGIPFVDLTRRKIAPDVLGLLPEETVEEVRGVPFEAPDARTVRVAFTEPPSKEALALLKKASGRKVEGYLTTRRGYLVALRSYQRDLAGELHALVDARIADAAKKGARVAAGEFPIIRIVDTVLANAVASGASDVHLEPLAGGLLVRFRVDGVLRDMLELPKDVIEQLIARVKILANLKIDEHRLPQDGRFSFAADDEDISVRVSILPTLFGEKAVLRILNESAQRFNLEELGFGERDLGVVRARIARPNGLILVVGPTGSGKTTTLYSLLSILNTERVNISTIEDPIEYGLPRINQTQIVPQVGYTFATGLRALLRQDPNVIMVGEIRDEDTAQIAVQSGLTGHLVLSTLHTNDAVGAIPRLMDMGVKPFIIAATLGAVIAQRLVRKICADCIESHRLSDAQIASLAKDFDIDAMLEALKRGDAISADINGAADLTFYHGKGCGRCGGSGYVGRVGVYEVFEMSEAMRDAVASGATIDVLERLARKEGMATLSQDGWRKALGGMTTLEEVVRVTRE